MKSKTIKTRETVQSIKIKNKRSNLNHYFKKNFISEKEPTVKDNKEEMSNQSYAVNHVAHAQKSTAISSVRRSKNYVRNKISSHRQREQAIKKAKATPKKSSVKTKKSIGNKAKLSHRPTQSSSDKLELKQPSSVKPTNYSSRMKSLMMSKHKDRVKKSKKARTYIAKKSRFIMKSAKGTVKTVSIAARTVSNLYAYGTALICLVILTLFMGVFACLSDDGGINSEIQPLSTQVLAYEKTITKYAEQYGIKEYVPIVEAIMMQESKGLGNDPMQSSESQYNTKFPRKPNGISDPDYSIEVGVHTFADCLSKAKAESPADTEKLYLALQGYNYGNGYIEWAITNFGGYTKANAKVFSDQMKYELKTDVYGDPNYVSHVMVYVNFLFRGGTNPNFSNTEAWITKNPYAHAKLYGQCTWFAWGRFYELYGYSPGFTGDGKDCVRQLLAAHKDKFEYSLTPKSGAVFSGIGNNHVGIVLDAKNNTLIIQEGNLDGKTNTFKDAQHDWHTKEYTLEQLRTAYKGVVFANPK